MRCLLKSPSLKSLVLCIQTPKLFPCWKLGSPVCCLGLPGARWVLPPCCAHIRTPLACIGNGRLRGEALPFGCPCSPNLVLEGYHALATVSYSPSRKKMQNTALERAVLLLFFPELSCLKAGLKKKKGNMKCPLFLHHTCSIGKSSQRFLSFPKFRLIEGKLPFLNIILLLQRVTVRKIVIYK